MRYLFPLFLIIPIIEIYVLLKASGSIGAGWTILLVIATAVIGAALVKQQGFLTLNNVQNKLSEGKMPAMELAEGVAILLAGALLLTPGFVTDTIGFACLISPIRKAMISFFIKTGVVKMNANVNVAAGGTPQYGRPGPDMQGRTSKDGIIEGEYKDIDK